MPDAFMCTWKKGSDELENIAKENSVSKLTYKSTFVPDIFLIKSRWQGVTAFAYLTFFKIHFMLFILSFQIVICLSVACRKVPFYRVPDPQLHSGGFELLKTQTLLLCKSLGKNQKNVQKVGVLFPLTDNRRFLQVNLSYFCCSNTADLLCKASSLSCLLPTSLHITLVCSQLTLYTVLRWQIAHVDVFCLQWKLGSGKQSSLTQCHSCPSTFCLA